LCGGQWATIKAKPCDKNLAWAVRTNSLVGLACAERRAPVAPPTPPDGGRGAANSLAAIAAHCTNRADKPPPQLSKARRPAFSFFHLRSGAWGAQRLTRRPPTLALRPAHSLTTASTKEKSSCLFITHLRQPASNNFGADKPLTPTKNNRAVTG